MLFKYTLIEECLNYDISVNRYMHFLLHQVCYVLSDWLPAYHVYKHWRLNAESYTNRLLGKRRRWFEIMAKIFCLFLINTQLPLLFGSIAQYEYIKQEVAPSYGELSCQVSPKSRLMDCVMLSLRSKSVSFFFNQNEHICRWDCVFLASRSCTTYCTEPWSYYGMYPNVSMLHHIQLSLLISVYPVTSIRLYQ